jgi:sugar porter (SP) family MFS transporter
LIFEHGRNYFLPMTAPLLTDSVGRERSLPAGYNRRFVWTISVVAALGGLLFGWDWVVVGGSKPFFEKFFRLNSSALSGWANSCALLGCLLGTVVTGGLSDKFGRKRLLILSAVLFASSSVLTGWASTFTMFVSWRILGGVAIGMASTLSPMYIAEVAPTQIRGRLVSINQLTIVIGVLAAQIVNWLIAQPVPEGASAAFIRESWNGQFGWRWMFTAVAAPSLIFLIGSSLIPESPRWLVKNGMADDAARILARIGGAAHAAAEVASIQETLSREEVRHVRFRDLLERRMIKILAVGVALAVLQQWSGINTIFNYAENIFHEAGYGVSSILFNIVITGVVTLTFTSIAIAAVDRYGRRVLMLAGCAGIALFHAAIGACYYAQLKGLAVVIPVMATIACYSFSLAPVTWVLIVEIFPNRIRGAAVSVAVAALWIACFVITFGFPMLEHSLGIAGTFWLYAGICAGGFILIWLRVPETKGKTLEQIEREFVD